AGGVSARMEVVVWVDGGGEARRVVVRRPWGEERVVQSGGMDEIYRILAGLWGAVVRVPRPWGYGEAGEVFAEPCLVMDFVAGAAVYGPRDGILYAEKMGEVLATIHGAKGDWSWLRGAGWYEGVDLRPREGGRDGSYRPYDEGLREREIREALSGGWRVVNEACLLHGDFWPGNVLWAEDEIVAVVDWEEAMVGDPLLDVAVTRLDLLWLVGEAGMWAFTERYRQLTEIDWGALGYWDLWAGLRPCGGLGVWAEPWAGLGRVDVTEGMMRARQNWFVGEALREVGGG
ncbi:MAG TPA: phosphotransferase, partial [Anaerolineae bacterium]|nr:phosphotransferase [Anaerolineae bacterium]